MTFDLGETPEVMGGVEVMSQGVQVKDIPETSRDVPTVRSFLGIIIAIALLKLLTMAFNQYLTWQIIPVQWACFLSKLVASHI